MLKKNLKNLGINQDIDVPCDNNLVSHPVILLAIQKNKIKKDAEHPIDVTVILFKIKIRKLFYNSIIYFYMILKLLFNLGHHQSTS